MERASTKTITLNRRARHEYFVEDSFEAGIELCGTEVKSLRKGSCNLKDSWCDIDHGELYIKQMHISPYEQGNIFNRDPYRPRKLLMHRREIAKLAALVAQQGYTLIPLLSLIHICYYRALQIGQASKVVPIDKCSVIITLVMAFLIRMSRSP